MSACTRWIILVALILLFAQGLWGEGPAIVRDEVRFTPGQTVVVKLHRGLGPKIIGQVVASDVDNLVVEHKSGKRIAVDWDSVRLIKRRESRSLWIGMGSGLAVAGIGLLAQGESVEPASAIFLGAGAASGAAFGRLLGSDEPPLYEAPKGESRAR